MPSLPFHDLFKGLDMKVLRTLFLLGSFATALCLHDYGLDGDPLSGVVTLYAVDELCNTYSFSSERHGGVVEDGELRGLGPELEFGKWYPGELSVVGSGGSVGTILNLGELRNANGSLYHYLQISESRDEVAFGSDSSGNVELRFSESSESSAVSAGDVCVLRIKNIARPVGEVDVGGVLWVKLLILESRGSSSVTFRWDLL